VVATFFIMLTDRFDEAFRYAHPLHRTQTRKGTPIPYISHLMAVALVVEHGGNEDQAEAGPCGLPPLATSQV
jgi:(p)ppGpp synthase/HD superfamily hydrolase